MSEVTKDFENSVLTDTVVAVEEVYKGPYVIEKGYQKGHLAVNGRIVPYIIGHVHEDGETVNLTLDGRFGITTTKKELDQWGWFMAHAMAVAAGFSSFGNPETSRLINLFGSHAPEVESEDMPYSS